MDIAKLGEFGLIDHLTKGYENKNASTVYGVGDDCAVMHYPDKEVLMTTDMLMEGVHFDLTYIDMQHLGYKSAMVNISDIFAMNGTPRQMVVSIALSKRFKVEDLDDFYKGLRMACDKWGVDIVGGDTTSSLTGLAISITCIGEAAKEDIVYRSGAKETDLICVSGDLGGAYMGQIGRASCRACSSWNAKRLCITDRWKTSARRWLRLRLAAIARSWLPSTRTCRRCAISSPTLPERNICCSVSSSQKHVATSWPS